MASAHAKSFTRSSHDDFVVLPNPDESLTDGYSECENHATVERHARPSRRSVPVYMQRISIYPDPEKIADVRSLLLERAKARQGAGIRLALSELVAGSDTPQFTVSTLFDDLAAFEAQRKRDQSDGDFQKFVGKIASLIRKPTAFDLMEVLVQMPS